MLLVNTSRGGLVGFGLLRPRKVMGVTTSSRGEYWVSGQAEPGLYRVAVSDWHEAAGELRSQLLERFATGSDASRTSSDALSTAYVQLRQITLISLQRVAETSLERARRERAPLDATRGGLFCGVFPEPDATLSRERRDSSTSKRERERETLCGKTRERERARDL